MRLAFRIVRVAGTHLDGLRPHRIGLAQHLGAQLLPVGDELRLRRLGCRVLVGDAPLRPREARLQPEDGFATLVGDHPSGGEGAPIANAMHHEADGHGVRAWAQKVRVERMQVAVLHGQARRPHRLRCDQTAKQPSFALRRFRQEEVTVERLQLEQCEQAFERGALRHGGAV